MRRLIILVLMLVCLVGAASAQEATPEPDAPAADSDAVTALRLEQLEARAEDAIGDLGWFLTIVEFISIGLGFLLAVSTILGSIAVFMGYRGTQLERAELKNNLKDFQVLRDEVNLALAELETQKKESTATLDKIEALSTQITSREQSINQRFETITKEAKQQHRALALVQLAQQQISIGNLESAKRSMHNALLLDDDNHVIRYFLGDVLLRLGELDEGIRYLDEARKDEQDHPEAQASYAYGIRSKGDREQPDSLKRMEYFAEAESIFLKLYPDHPMLLDISGESVYGALAGIYRRRDDNKNALLWYENVLKATPTNSYPLNNLALLNYLEGSKEPARQYFEKSLRVAQEVTIRFPYDYWAWFDVATAKIALEAKKDDIVQDLQTAFDLQPGPDPLRKLLEGLRELQQAPQPPSSIDDYIHLVEAEINDA